MNGHSSDPPGGGSAQARSLRAGPLALRFDAGDLRYVKWGGREVLRRLYAAVRDHNWNTVPGEIADLECQGSDDAFHITYTCSHRQGAVHFVWRADIEGNAQGSIRFAFDGVAKATFLRNRIGLCVLHPIRECAGATCRATYANGTERHLRFPDIIAAEQPVRWLHDLAGLAHEVAPGAWAELEFEGDLFEVEDQRNWIDASFKTYGTPLRLPFPMEIRAGTRVRQEVRLRLVERSEPSAGGAGVSDPGSPTGVFGVAATVLAPREDGTIVVHGAGATTRLPSLGLGTASHGLQLPAEEARRLRALRLAHLRVDLRLWEIDWLPRLERAAGEAERLGARLEVALHLDAIPEEGLASAADALAGRRALLARVLVFHRDQKSTTAAALEAAREVLGSAVAGVPLGAGTDADLYQLNLQRPPAEADFICWSMNPQVHAFDDASVAETPEAAAHQVISVRRYYPGKPLVVSPVTLRPRFNPNATGPAPALAPGELPPQVDPRQPSLFGAAWTLAMLKALAESGADSVTLFETTGWRGVMETAAGPPIPETFRSVPGGVFPLYHVLADVGEFAGGEVLRTESSEPLAVASLCLRRGGRRRLLVANLGQAPLRVSLSGLDGMVRVRRLDASSASQAMASPDSFRAAAAAAPAAQVELGPGAVATLDSPSD